MKIPRTMSTHHPDNVLNPFFASDSVLGGEDEIQEAYYVFSHLGCQEQMWDCEGKEVDNYVVRKLLTKYEHYFKENRLGQNVFLTLRVPNPTVEKNEAKVLLEALESIPRSFDTAKLFYGEDIAPVFEVILPMTTTAKCLNRVYSYYRDFVIKKESLPFFEGDISIADWIGEFKPKEINVIPLVEDKEHMLEVADIAKEYLEDKEVKYQRIFLARSDPAMNYGLFSAILLNKIALQRLYKLENKLGVPLYPIIGIGSTPFRGNLKPENVQQILTEFPSVQTFTIQSAFKFDNPEKDVLQAIYDINKGTRSKPTAVDEEKAIQIIEKYSTCYTAQIEKLAPLINSLAKHVPSRRKRKLHVGLFGYSRGTGKVTLPRAIVFCATLYSVGLPPEILAYGCLTKEELDFLKDVYPSLDKDLADALPYFNPRVKEILISDIVNELTLPDIQTESNQNHLKITSRIIDKIKEDSSADLKEDVVEAAWERKFLG